MKKIILGAVAAMLLVAPAADAKAFRGTVVKKGTRSVVVATKTGTLKTVKTSRHLKLGTQLRVAATPPRASCCRAAAPSSPSSRAATMAPVTR